MARSELIPDDRTIRHAGPRPSGAPAMRARTRRLRAARTGTGARRDLPGRTAAGTGHGVVRR